MAKWWRNSKLLDAGAGFGQGPGPLMTLLLSTSGTWPAANAGFVIDPRDRRMPHWAGTKYPAPGTQEGLV